MPTKLSWEGSCCKKYQKDAEVACTYSNLYPKGQWGVLSSAPPTGRENPEQSNVFHQHFQPARCFPKVLRSASITALLSASTCALSAHSGVHELILSVTFFEASQIKCFLFVQCSAVFKQSFFFFGHFLHKSSVFRGQLLPLVIFFTKDLICPQHNSPLLWNLYSFVQVWV